MKVEYINPFISSAKETFETMMQVELKAENPYLKNNSNARYDVSGIIGISGDAKGSVTLGFSKKAALKAVSKFMGMEIKIVDADFSDAVGELVNIIAGNAKKDLADLNVMISLPNVIIGEGHQVESPKGIQTIIIPFNSEIGDVVIEVNLKTP